jgi:Immunity protein 35
MQNYRFLAWPFTLVFGLGVLLQFFMTSEAQQPSVPITKPQALEIAQRTISAMQPRHNFVILEKKTVERDFGWVFFYTTKEYLETQDPKYLVPGNSPLVVNRMDGSTQFLSTSTSPAHAIDEYEKRWRESVK